MKQKLRPREKTFFLKCNDKFFEQRNWKEFKAINETNLITSYLTSKLKKLKYSEYSLYFKISFYEGTQSEIWKYIVDLNPKDDTIKVIKCEIISNNRSVGTVILYLKKDKPPHRSLLKKIRDLLLC